MLNQNRQPLITVITSYYNDQDFLADAIQSVLSQTYQNFEYILVNHASEDRSRAIAHSFKDSRIKHVDLSINYGATGSFLVKAGLDCASPDSVYVKLLSADDVLLPRALESLLCVSLSPRRPDLVFGDIEFVARDKRPLGFTWFSSRCPAGLSEAQYLRRYLEGASVLPFAGCFAKTRVLCSICMDFTTVSVTDMIFWSSILLCGGVLDFVREPVALYRVHEL